MFCRNRSTITERKNSILFIYIFMVLFISFFASGSEKVNRKDQLADYMERINKGDLEPAFEKKIQSDLSRKELPLLEPYCSHRNPSVRRMAYALVAMTTEKSTVTLERRLGVEIAIRAVCDPDPGVRQVTRRALKNFSEADYSDVAKQFLSDQLRDCVKVPVHGRDTGKLLGIIGLIGRAKSTGDLEVLRQVRSEYNDVFQNLDKKYISVKGQYRQKVECPWLGTPGWITALVRARMGVKEEIAFCIQLVDDFPDEEFKSKVLYDALTYIESPEVVSYLYKKCQDETPVVSDDGHLPNDLGREPKFRPAGDFAFFTIMGMTVLPEHLKSTDKRKLFLEEIKDPGTLQIRRR